MKKFHIVERVQRVLFARINTPSNDIDGARITFPDGWALVSGASNHGTGVDSIAVKAKTPEILRRDRVQELHFLAYRYLGFDSRYPLQACQKYKCSDPKGKLQ